MTAHRWRDRAIRGRTLPWRAALAAVLGLSSCASDCSSTKRYTLFDVTTFAATPAGMAVRVEKRRVTDKGWANGSGDVVLEARDLRVTDNGLVRAEGDLAYDALANGNRLEGLALRTPTGESAWSLGVRAGCDVDRTSPHGSIAAVAPNRTSFAVLRECTDVAAGQWNLLVIADTGAPLVDLLVTPPSSAPFLSTSLAVANDHTSALSFLGSGLFVKADGAVTPVANLAGTVVGAVGPNWITQEGVGQTNVASSVRFHFLAPDGQELRLIEIVGLERIHLGTRSSFSAMGEPTTEPMKLFGDRLFVMKTRSLLPAPQDGQTLSEHTLQQYGHDGALLREDPIAF